MKKIILSCLFVVGTISVFGQNVSMLAKKAAQDAGCLEEAFGNNEAYEYQINNLGGCASGPATTSAWIEVLITPKVNAHIGPMVRLSPLARVTFCGNEVLTVECL